MKHAVLYWSGFGWCVALAPSMTEHAGPFPKLHDAWRAADADGLEVLDVLTSAGVVKHRAPVEREVVTTDG